MPIKKTLSTFCLTTLTLLTMTACPAQNNKPSQEQIDDLIVRTKANLVFVEGGTFTMGDFGPITREDKLPLTSFPHNKHLHDVTLDSFSMMALRVTYTDYDLYTASKGLPRVEETYKDTSLPSIRQVPNMPVGVNWPEANGYCQWLGEITGLPMSLPTEAQWEYAARNRGQFVVFPTDNGEFEEGRNFASFSQKESYVRGYPDDPPQNVNPNGLFPPTPLGLYDMGFGGSEWMLAWYAADYYKLSPTHNPQGPESGERKVLRGSTDHNAEGHTTVFRRSRELDTRSYWDCLIRCVVNSPQPVKP